MPSGPPTPCRSATLVFGKHCRPVLIRADPSAAPSRTLYLRNLPEHLGHTTLQRLLMRKLEVYGMLLAVQCHRGLKKRGQAWATFKRLDDAVAAFDECQGAEFLGRPLMIQYARMRSKVAAEDEGDLEAYEREREARNEERDAQDESGSAPKGLPYTPIFPGLPAFPPGFAPAPPAAGLGAPMLLPPGAAGGAPPVPLGLLQAAPGMLPPGMPPGMLPPPPGMMPPGMMPPPGMFPPGLAGMPPGMPPLGAPPGGAFPGAPAAAPGAASAPAAVPDDLVPPNPVLFVAGLPPGTTRDPVHAAFAKFAGYLESRVVPSRGVAFIEFKDEHCSAAAKRELDGKALPGSADAGAVMKITFRK